MRTDCERILGVRVDALEPDELLALVGAWRSSGRTGYVCCANVHVIETARTDGQLRAALEAADVVVPDGKPVAWQISRQEGRPVRRVSGGDIFETFASDAPGYRHYFYGSSAAVLADLRQALGRLHPSLEIAGMHSPPFRELTSVEKEAVAAQINAAEADVVWVGLGAPKQEKWMHEMRPLLHAPMLCGVGAVFEFVAGTRKRAPEALQARGLEWAFRLAQEPRRLAGRYVSTNATFLARLAYVAARDGVGRR